MVEARRNLCAIAGGRKLSSDACTLRTVWFLPDWTGRALRGLFFYAAMGVSKSAPDARLEFTRGSTRQNSKRSSGAAFMSVAAPLPSSPSHSGHSLGVRLTGIRWWILDIASLAAVVTIAQVVYSSSPRAHFCQTPAKAMRPPAAGRIIQGRRLPSVSFVHSLKPVACIMQRLSLAATLKAGFSAIVSDRALIRSGPPFGVLYQWGRKPQRIAHSLRPSAIT